MPNIFFTSDTHYHHKNIVRGCTEWKDGDQEVRDFDTLGEHDTVLVQNINAIVKENDILYHLGDWSFGGIDQIWEFRKQLHCQNIHLVLGNHDHHIDKNKRYNFQTDYDRLVSITDGFGLDHYSHNNGLRIMFSSVDQLIMNKKINGQSMCLSHFAQRVWDKSHHGHWNLYGHSHGTLSDYRIWVPTPTVESPGQQTYYPAKSMDVGIDAHPEFRPYHFDEIAAIMKNRINLRVDHHNENTN